MLCERVAFLRPLAWLFLHDEEGACVAWSQCLSARVVNGECDHDKYVLVSVASADGRGQEHESVPQISTRVATKNATP
jgi:hypothetical protein